MDEVTVEPSSDGHGERLGLEVAFATLNEVLLDHPDLETLLTRIAELAAAIVPGARCSITFDRRRADAVAHVDPSGTDGGIPRQRERDRVCGDREGDQVTHQVPGGVSLPLVADGVTIGALRLDADSWPPTRDADLEHARAFADQAATVLVLSQRESAHLVLDGQLQEALVTRSVIDQAMGVLMHARRISGRRAFGTLRRISQDTNRKVHVLAAELILKMTGHPPAKPRPLTRREAAVPHHTDATQRSGEQDG